LQLTEVVIPATVVDVFPASHFDLASFFDILSVLPETVVEGTPVIDVVHVQVYSFLQDVNIIASTTTAATGIRFFILFLFCVPQK
jgi:hypothetical protein